MKPFHLALPLAAIAAILTTGCSSRTVVIASPPPPLPTYHGQSILVDVAERNGHHDGAEAGRRDAINNYGYHPQREPRFHNTPGYDPSLGPFGPYRDYYRNAYLRAYYGAFQRHE